MGCIQLENELIVDGFEDNADGIFETYKLRPIKLST